MKHIIFVTGYPGAGKTTLLKNLHAQSTHLDTYLCEDSPLADSLYKLPVHGQVGSKWCYNGAEYVTAGCFRKSDTIRQGVDIFLKTTWDAVIDYLCTKGDIIIWESFNIGPAFLKKMQHHRLSYLHLDLPREECEKRRDARYAEAGQRAKLSKDIGHIYDAVDRRWERAQKLATCYRSSDALNDLASLLQS
jgi:predicted kinase